MAVAGLLFLAFAFFVVGQGAASRNKTQSAADSAALAAVQGARTQLRAALLNTVTARTNWWMLLDGNMAFSPDPCDSARRFADRNGADVFPDARGCYPVLGGRVGFTVSVRAQKPVGSSVIPGTEDMHSEAKSTAIIVPKCVLLPDGTPGGGGGETPKPGKGKNDSARHIKLRCLDNHTWDIDPADTRNFPEAAALFSARLADSE